MGWFHLLFAIAHAIIFVWAVRLYREDAPGSLIVALIGAGLVYDNGLLFLGSYIGVGSTLELLSWPRFILHAFLTPFLMFAVLYYARAAGSSLALKPAMGYVTVVFVTAGVLLAVFEDLIPLELKPACHNGMVRYTGNLIESQLCSADYVAARTGGPPWPSIVANIAAFMVGIRLLRLKRWIWLLAGSIAMFVAASPLFPFETFALAPGNFGEVLLQLAFAATSAQALIWTHEPAASEASESAP